MLEESVCATVCTCEWVTGDGDKEKLSAGLLSGRIPRVDVLFGVKLPGGDYQQLSRYVIQLGATLTDSRHAIPALLLALNVSGKPLISLRLHVWTCT